MIQDQLVDYISSQIKLGVSRDAIKAALVTAGWVAADVEDTLKKVEGTGGASAQAARPVATASPMGSSVASSPAMGAGAFMKPAEKVATPQTIRVSDLVSSSFPSGTSSAASKDAMKSGPGMSGSQGMSAATSSKSGHGMLAISILSVLVVVLGGLSGYFFWQNNNLMTQVGSVNTQSQGVVGQVSSLQTQVQALNASNTALAAQITTLTNTNQALVTNLSFLTVAPSTPSSGLVASDVSIAGLLSGGKPTYILTTSYGVKLAVKNSTDAGVHAALQSLLGTSTTVTIAGNYIPGTAMITVTSVNGASITAPVTASTTTAAASTTPPAASSTPAAQ